MVYNPETLWTLRNAVAPIIEINLDPSHLIALGQPHCLCQGTERGNLPSARQGCQIERGLAEINGLPEWKAVTEVADRPWNYVAVGCGKDLQWWKEFFSVCRMMGYERIRFLEMEDLTMSTKAGVLTSIDALKQTISL